MSPSLWRDLSELVRVSQEHRCGQCGAEAKPKKKLQVDHIVPRRLMTKWKLDGNARVNLIALCELCHGKKTMAECLLLRGDLVGFLQRMKENGYPMDRAVAALRNAGMRVPDAFLPDDAFERFINQEIVP